MSHLQIGQQAPNIEVRNMAGETVDLAETWRAGRNVLLIFLRHLH